MSKKISVVIIEDNAVYRSAVELALGAESDIELIGQFSTAEVALRTMTELSLSPLVILLDIRLPGMSGLDSIKEIQSHSPNSKIVVLTQSDQEKDVLRAVSLGAVGYLMKSSTLAELVDGIRTVAGGGAILASSIAKFILQSLQSQVPERERESLLSQREMDVLALLAEGLVKKEIAKKLGIGYSTVDTHVGRIYAKLHVKNAPAAVNIAHRLNLFPPTEEA